MGCCFSSAGKALSSHRSPVIPRISLEEETVKEVLSETPFPPKPQPPGGDPKATVPEPEEAKIISAVNGKPEEDKEEGGGRVASAPEDASEYSEMCSVSESLSTATTSTIVMEKREDEVTSTSRDCREFARVKPRVSRSSPLKAPRKRLYVAGDGKRGMIKSPAPRSGPAQSRRPSPTRTQGAATRTARTAARHYGGSVGNGRDMGGGSYRRSRSPATRRDGMIGRSPARSVGSGGGARSVDPARARASAGDPKDLEEEGGVQRKVAEEEANGDVLKKGNDGETLDNPLVSLECFIFF
ncbi:uncharacterized protein LOC116202741 [Punica granatum]|uniref:Serine/arginine repetitive matrix protein 1-like n=2 Tax=Punica granatum TaxID=22663 RepID=A0A218Y2D3_PUNGR|nr:uncharacterized protein LOC116202741 [Punica granatum]OWM90999.1 hypothetical protein CDL15_Pgr023332 [Punica granatum]PKI52958.1 hypothetical protein CRG98_026664 [Punica granatum]